MGHPSNTLFDPSGSTETTSRLHKANVVMSLNTLRNRCTVVSCQLARLRLLPTAQATKAALDTGGRKTTEWRAVQFWNAIRPTPIKSRGSVSEVSPVQFWNALWPTSIKCRGNVSEVSPVQFWNAPAPTIFKDFGSVREVIPVQ